MLFIDLVGSAFTWSRLIHASIRTFFFVLVFCLIADAPLWTTYFRVFVFYQLCKLVVVSFIATLTILSAPHDRECAEKVRKRSL